MKYAYIGKEYHAEVFRETFAPRVEMYLKKWLEAIIFTEQPYLAEGLKIENPDAETASLLQFCKFFTAVLNDERPDPDTLVWDLEFEGKHHSLMSMYINFLGNVYNANDVAS